MIHELIRRLPKAELHLHIEGTLEPEMMFALAARNGVSLPFPSVEALRAAYDFSDLQSFLDLYYAGVEVLRSAADFRDLTAAYCRRAHEDGVVHAEIFFDPQTHTARGLDTGTVIDGITEALDTARREFGFSSRLIACFLRHLSEEQGFAALDELQPYIHRIDGFGLDSGERDNPPSRFRGLFERCRRLGLPVVAHAGEEGPASYVREALDLLGACRIDHGVRCTEDPELVERLARTQVPLTVCPLSNLRLRVVPDLSRHNLRELLERGLCVTVNSDDPAYFGGYINDNLEASQRALGLDATQVVQLVRNGFTASWLPDADKRHWQDEISRVVAGLDAVSAR